MGRLERAVQDLVTVTAGQLGDRATQLIDDTSKRLEAELRVKRASSEDPEVEIDVERRQRRRRQRHEQPRKRGGRLMIDRRNEKIAGVCAGLAPYLGVEIWMVRLAAVTGLLFIPHIVFPAYWIAYFVMEKPGKNDMEDREPSSRRRRRRSRRRERAEQQQMAASSKSTSDPQDAQAEFNARRNLRYSRTDLTQAELRLRRLESFITSDQYELQKELHRIEKEASAT